MDWNTFYDQLKGFTSEKQKQNSTKMSRRKDNKIIAKEIWFIQQMPIFNAWS